MFLFFIALVIQSLIERKIRGQMKDYRLASLQLYPENRGAAHPTTCKVFGAFSDVSTYVIAEGESVVEECLDELNSVQRSVLELLGISENQYWHGIPT